MDLKIFFTVFLSIFFAEMADKTQIATLLYASSLEKAKITVFLASSLALICTTAIAVVGGSIISQWVQSKAGTLIVGLGFMVVGLWVILKGWF
jgi:putative Ca2+/H+ antiporter (TMEM165/GDT1 family)